MAGTAAGLADESQPGQLLDQFASEPRALANRHDHFRVAQISGQGIERWRGVAEDAHVMTGERSETVQFANETMVIVGNGDDHDD